MTTDKNPKWEKTVKVEESGYYWKGDPVFFKPSQEETEKKRIAIEFFCGCGGTSLGFEMAGFHIFLGNDIHKPSIDTFTKNHKSSHAILGDIKKVKESEVLDLLNGRQVDVLIAGVPCQGFSLNNRKRHLGDERNTLYKEFTRMIRLLKPKAILLENVSGMKSSGDTVQRIERDLSIAGGMVVKSRLLNALDYGVPQNRKRLVFVGVKDSVFDFDKIIKTHGLDADSPLTTIREAIGDLPSLNAGESAKKYKSIPKSEYQKLMRRNNNTNNLTNHKAPNHPLETIEKIRNTVAGDPMYPRFKQRIRLKWDMQSPTQVSGGIRPQFQFGHPSDARGLTIRERCRIQSFPDSFIVSGGIVQGRVQTGNAVPPLLAKAVAEAILKYI